MYSRNEMVEQICREKIEEEQVAQLSQRYRAAGGVSFGKNISAKILHLISL